VCNFTLQKGQSAAFIFGALEQNEQGEINRDDVQRDLEATLGYWREWSGKSAYTGRWRDAVTGSALTLKMLTSRRYGSLVAALTFGLPEHIGGSRNWAAEWTAQQLREAFPWETAPRYLPRDRDTIFGPDLVKQVKAMGIQQVLSAPRSPWQRAYIERVIGTLRRECLDHVIVFSEAGLYRHLRNFADYYHRSRTHVGLQKDTPEPRPIQPPEAGRIIAIPEVGGLHHRYERRAA